MSVKFIYIFNFFINNTDVLMFYQINLSKLEKKISIPMIIKDYKYLFVK